MQHTFAVRLPRFTTACALICAALATAGCDTFTSDPVTLIKDMRLIAIRADPPFIAGPGQTKAPLGSQTTLTPLIADRGSTEQLCYAWRLCPFAWAKDGNYKCVSEKLEVDLGTNPTAKVSALDVFKSLENFEEVIEELGLGNAFGGGGPTSAGGARQQQQDSATGLEATVLFMIGKQSVFGGSCPKTSEEMLRDVCPQRAGCVQGYTKLSLATNDKQANTAPVIDEVRMGGVLWPAALTPTVAPYIVDDPNAPTGLDQEARKRGLEMGPRFDPAVMELIKPAEGVQPEVRETLSFSWYSTHGRFRYSKTSDRVTDNRYTPLPPGEDHSDEADMSQVTASIWLVARDSRNGITWRERKVIIDKNLKSTDHPLCAMDASLDGCDKVAK